MQHIMDDVEFKFDHGTEVRMRRRRKWLSSEQRVQVREYDRFGWSN
jgi:hypothetical protein